MSKFNYEVIATEAVMEVTAKAERKGGTLSMHPETAQRMLKMVGVADASPITDQQRLGLIIEFVPDHMVEVIENTPEDNQWQVAKDFVEELVEDCSWAYRTIEFMNTNAKQVRKINNQAAKKLGTKTTTTERE